MRNSTEISWYRSLCPWNTFKRCCAAIVNNVTLFPERARNMQDSRGQLFLEWQGQVKKKPYGNAPV